MNEIQIKNAEKTMTLKIAKLFQKYREFYRIPSRLEDCVQFILDRMEKSESMIFVALDSQQSIVGFVQMYPLFSEVTLKKIWLLNDLFVDSAYRRYGIGERLMKACQDFVHETGGSEITLSTAIDNLAAQKLYEKLGYHRNTEFFVYNYYLE